MDSGLIYGGKAGYGLIYHSFPLSSNGYASVDDRFGCMAEKTAELQQACLK